MATYEFPNWPRRGAALAAMIAAVCVGAPCGALAFTLEVVDGTGAPVAGFKYTVEEDTTYPVDPGVPSVDIPSLGIHHTYAPVVASGASAGGSVEIALPTDKRYFASVVAAGHTMSGAAVAVGQGRVTVTVQAHPIPPGQISVLVFQDNQPVNAAPDVPAEPGLEGFTVLIADAAGQVSLDVFGNPLGTTYDANGAVLVLGDGLILTDVNGEALIKNLAPDKYAVSVIPPPGTDWIQTSTVEGKNVVDAWPKAGEPSYFVEAGTFQWHAFFGFIHPMLFPPMQGGGTITGQAVYVHEQKPPLSPGLTPGRPVWDGWIALTSLDQDDTQVYGQPTDPDGYFVIEDVPPGTYQMAIFDRFLDVIIDYRTITVDAGVPLFDMGQVAVYAWFGYWEGSVFYDFDQDGVRDPGEPGIPRQAINLRHSDGSIYQATATDDAGDYYFHEVFPFFHWLVGEVDFTRFRATGATVVVDDGGALEPGAVTAPQPQPENGGQGFRTDVGEVLLEGMLLYAGHTHAIDWGKAAYGPGENGGISGIVHYATTRAEDDPRFSAAEPWEPGVPRVQVALYLDDNNDGVIDDLIGADGPTLADVDNWPFGWAEGDVRGDEDVDHNDNQVFDAGDALAIVTTDSWDDNLPTGCVGDPQTALGQPVPDCAETMRTYNQVRPAVFDGGYAFTWHVPDGIASGNAPVDGLPSGVYIVEAAAPKGYLHQREEDKNVDFGDEYVPTPEFLPPFCVGEEHVVDAELSLFPGVESAFAGVSRPLCDLKQVAVRDGKNAAADFNLFTEAPIAARIWGMTLNDVLLEFDPNSPMKGQNFGVPWLPVAIKDHTGKELVRTYTDQWGHYNALVPSFYTNAIAKPSGLSQAILTVCVNDPGPRPDPPHPEQATVDPWYNPSYQVACTNWDFLPGRTTRLDTPLLPIAAFTDNGSGSECDYPSGTPMLAQVTSTAGGPALPTVGGALTITSMGTVTVPNRAYDPDVVGSTPTVQVDYGFGSQPGQVFLDATALSVTDWASDGRTITVNVPSGARVSQLKVVRRDNGKATPLGVTVTVGGTVARLQPGQTIQQAIDAAPTGATLLIPPGTYYENVILHKRLRLQGWGAGSTIIAAGQASPEQRTAWDQKVADLEASGAIQLVPGERADFFLEALSGILVATRDGEFTTAGARIDGFTISGATLGGGIFVNAYARNLVISNNRLVSNQGSFGGGIRVGTPSLVDAEGLAGQYRGSENQRLQIHHNWIAYNGAIDGGGGVALFKGADLYRVTENRICGNYTLLYGGGLAHFGLSPSGLIQQNEIIANQSTDEGGGLVIAGELVHPLAPVGALSEGSGTVTVNRNLIQANLAGDDGGGVRLLMVNGQDVADSPADSRGWHQVSLTNNLIVNNASADAGGGLALDDVARGSIIYNTISHNDSTATGVDAFGGPCVDGVVAGFLCAEGNSLGGLTSSVPQVAGVVARAHSAGLQGAFAPSLAQAFSNPVFRNNVVWHNRAFWWDATANGGLGGLQPDVANGEPAAYWDLGVYGTLTPASLAARYCDLSETSGTHATNVELDPGFVAPYHNVYKATSKGAALGNFVVATFDSPGADGNYHLQPTSPVMGRALSTAGAAYATDFDGQTRPNGAPDIGADEVVVPAAAPFLKTRLIDTVKPARAVSPTKLDTLSTSRTDRLRKHVGRTAHPAPTAGQGR